MMSMLIFQVAKIAPEAQPIKPGTFQVPLRMIDDGDCVSTVDSDKIDLEDSPDCLSIEVVLMQEPLSFDEVGSAVSVILGDVQRSKTVKVASVECTAKLVLMKYPLGTPNSKDSFWILQRELRTKGLDICLDESYALVGHAESRESKDGDKLALNLVKRFRNLSDRDGSLVDRDALQRKSVLIIGLGSLGSAIACDLARSGVGRFALADNERLEWGNVVRHAAGLSDVGRLKTKIVAGLVRDRNPYAEIREIPLALGSASKEEYEREVASADVVICATDSKASRMICNRLCIKRQKKVVFGGLTKGAYAGMVFQFQSPKTMCYHCFVTSFPEAAADRESNESDYAGGPDGHLAIDIGPIANLMAKLAVVELQRQIGIVTSGLDSDLAAPWFIWINRREGEYAELNPLGSPTKGPEILAWRPVLLMDKNEECPHCGTVSYS